MEGSLRESDEPGHIAAAVYEVNKSRTVVIGVYGISENNDRSSADLIQEVSNIARELKHLYNTQHVIVAGDFRRGPITRRLERPPHQKNKNNRKAAYTARTTQPHRPSQCCQQTLPHMVQTEQ